MEPYTISEAIEEFTNIVKTRTSTDATDILVRASGLMPPEVAITALSHLFVVAWTRGEYDRAKLLRLQAEDQEPEDVD